MSFSKLDGKIGQSTIHSICRVIEPIDIHDHTTAEAEIQPI